MYVCVNNFNTNVDRNYVLKEETKDIHIQIYPNRRISLQELSMFGVDGKMPVLYPDIYLFLKVNRISVYP